MTEPLNYDEFITELEALEMDDDNYYEKRLKLEKGFSKSLSNAFAADLPEEVQDAIFFEAWIAGLYSTDYEDVEEHYVAFAGLAQKIWKLKKPSLEENN